MNHYEATYEPDLKCWVVSSPGRGRLPILFREDQEQIARDMARALTIAMTLREGEPK